MAVLGGLPPPYNLSLFQNKQAESLLSQEGITEDSSTVLVTSS